MLQSALKGLMAILAISFFQMSRVMFSLAVVCRPAAVNASAIFPARSPDAAPEFADLRWQIGKILDHAGPDNCGTLRGEPAQNPIRADDLADRRLVAEPVLEADRRGAARKHRRRRPDRISGVIPLRLHQHDVDRSDRPGIGGRRHRHQPIAAISGDPETGAGDLVDVLAPGVHQDHIQAAFTEQSAEQASHRPCPQDRDPWPIAHLPHLPCVCSRTAAGPLHGTVAITVEL